MTSPDPSTSSGDDEPPLNSWKMARYGFAITCARTLRRPRCAMPSAMSLHAERSAALDDLLERRDHQFAAIETESLRPGELHVAELLKALGLDELVEDRALALAGEGDLLVRPLDALLDPALLLRVGDVHVLDAERLAVGAAKDGDDLVQRSELAGRARDRGKSAGRNRRQRSRSYADRVRRGPAPARDRVDRDWHADGRACDRHGSASGAHRIRAPPAGRARAEPRRLDLALARLDLVAEALSISGQSPSSAAMRSPRAAAANRRVAKTRRGHFGRCPVRSPSGSQRTPAIAHPPPADRCHSGHKARRYNRHCRHTERRSVRRPRWHLDVT